LFVTLNLSGSHAAQNFLDAWTGRDDPAVTRRGRDLGRHRFTVIERGRRIGARRPPPEFQPPPPDLSRPPLPAGHPQSWEALTVGTVLEGTDYPLPVFTR
jgi:hypothetical protein